MKIGIIVPTKDRPKDIERLLKSIEAQTRSVDELIIVDGSDNPVKKIVDQFSTLPIRYIAVRPPSLPAQRNAGIEAVSKDIDWVGFLDDDLVLMDGALEAIEKSIRSDQAEKLGAVGLRIADQPTAKAGMFNRLFLMEGRPGTLTASGFASGIPPVTEDIETEWIYGGATFWRRTIFEDFLFDEWFKGTGYLEDVDFSYRVSRKYKLKVCSQAECLHLSHPIQREKQQSIGEWQIVSWWYFVNKYPEFAKTKVLWSMQGLLLRNVFKCAFGFSVDSFLRVRGNVEGLARIFSGTAKESKGFSKSS